MLSRTPDILAGLGERWAGKKDAPVLVGFAAETDEVIARAREKLRGKRCDLVVANRVGGPGAGFGGDTNRVALVSGPTQLADPPGVTVVRVETAEQMAHAVELASANMDLFVGAAAVSDYRPATTSPHKIKKGKGDETLVLARTPDILAGLGERWAGKKDAPVLVGFAAETEEVNTRAREKLKGKRCDLVVANRVGGPGAGFGGDTNRVALVSATELAEIEGPKERIAEAILDWIVPVLEGRRPKQAT